jgi:hypothetical protein
VGKPNKLNTRGIMCITIPLIIAKLTNGTYSFPLFLVQFLRCNYFWVHLEGPHKINTKEVLPADKYINTEIVYHLPNEINQETDCCSLIIPEYRKYIKVTSFICATVYFPKHNISLTFYLYNIKLFISAFLVSKKNILIS